MTGTVVKWVDNRGFGFISPDAGGADVYVHRTQLATGRKQDTLAETERVEFDVKPGRGKMEATNVRRILDFEAVKGAIRK